MKQIFFPDYNNSILNFSCSILKHFKIDIKHNSLPEVDNILTKNFQNIVVILLDGLGINILEKHLKPTDFLRKHLFKEYSSIYPPTTTASTTSIMSGLAPIEHGWLGWDVYFKQEDKIVTCFRNTFAGTDTVAADYSIANKYLPYKDIATLINEKGSGDAEIIFPWLLEKPGDLDNWILKIKNRCKKKSDTKENPKFTYAYWEQPDGALHEFGSNHPTVHESVLELNKKIEQLCSELENTLVFITADHGHIDIERNFIEENYPDIAEMLIRPTSLEPRAISFYVKEEFIHDFKNKFLEYFEKDYLLYTKEEVFKNHLFGYGTEHKNLTGIGDFIAIAKGTKTLFWNKNTHPFKSHHAGITEEEMKIPLIVIEK